MALSIANTNYAAINMAMHTEMSIAIHSYKVQ